MYNGNHPVFEKPEDENIKIWRYLDFTKFVSLLDRQSLFFTTVTNLDDKFEGLYNEATIKYLLSQNEGWRKIFPLQKQIREFTLINCWHRNEHESAAMWKLYLKSNEGIAVQSTFSMLAESFKDDLENDVYIGEVKYIDFTKELIPFQNSHQTIVHKRKSFEHERELRAVILGPPVRLLQDSAKHNACINKWIEFGGAYIPISLDKLIEQIIVSPTAPHWFVGLVKSVMEHYGLNKKVIGSELDKRPIY